MIYITIWATYANVTFVVRMFLVQNVRKKSRQNLILVTLKILRHYCRVRNRSSAQAGLGLKATPYEGTADVSRDKSKLVSIRRQYSSYIEFCSMFECLGWFILLALPACIHVIGDKTYLKTEWDTVCTIYQGLCSAQDERPACLLRLSACLCLPGSCLLHACLLLDHFLFEHRRTTSAQQATSSCTRTCWLIDLTLATMPDKYFATETRKERCWESS